MKIYGDVQVYGSGQFTGDVEASTASVITLKNQIDAIRAASGTWGDGTLQNAYDNGQTILLALAGLTISYANGDYFVLDSDGIHGFCSGHYGLYGSSTSEAGVYGVSATSYGVYGRSNGSSYGVYGYSANSNGVRGESVNSWGVYGVSTASYGVYGVSTNNYGGYFTSVAYPGFRAESTNNVAGQFDINPASYNSIAEVFRVRRHTSGTAASGIGGSFNYWLENAAGETEYAGGVALIYTTVTNGQECSAWAWYNKTAGGAPREVARLDDKANYNIGTNTRDATATKCLRLANGTDPTGVAGVAGLVATSGSLYAFDEAGSKTLISPHDDEGNWIFYSKNVKTGKVLKIHMEKMMRKLNEILGEGFIEEFME